MIKYRPPVSSYAEAMEKVVEIDGLPALVTHINEHILTKGIDEPVSLDEIEFVRYMSLPDSRNGWDTYIVVCKDRNGVFGYTDGVLGND